MLIGESYYMEGFRERFLKLKLEKNVTLEEIANSIGSYKATLSKLVNGKAKITDDMLTELSRYFGVTKAYLLGESNFKVSKDEFPPEITEIMRDAVDSKIDIKKLKATIDFLKAVDDLKEK